MKTELFQRFILAAIVVCSAMGTLLFYVAVYADNFNADLLPGAHYAFKIGDATRSWASINQFLYFSGNKVGIGTPTPRQTLEVDGTLRLVATSRPTCSPSSRSTLWVTLNGVGAKDDVAVCARDANGAYAWRVIY